MATSASRRRIGAHLHRSQIRREGLPRWADICQVFISNPRGWAHPKGVGELGEKVWVHNPYLANVVSPNPDVRYKSLSQLEATLRAAGEAKAAGVVVHAGQETEGDLEAAYRRWAAAAPRLAEVAAEAGTLLLVENTAGGKAAPGRHLDDWLRLAEIVVPAGIGLCVDTAHAWAAGWEPERLAEAGTVGASLLHVNSSVDGFGSGRDHHANIGTGEMPESYIAEMLEVYGGVDAVTETPGGPEGQRADIEVLRQLEAGQGPA